MTGGSPHDRQRLTAHRPAPVTILTRLRRSTGRVHRELEADLDLLSTAVDRGRLADVVAGLDAFWRSTEPAVDAWARAHPELAAELRWPRRRTAARGARDLEALGLMSRFRPAGAPVLDPVGTADLLGWLYVREGSTLGGAIIQRHVSSTLGVGRLLTFSPYDEGPGPMWSSYLDVLHRWTDTEPSRGAGVVAAAQLTFGRLRSALLVST